MSLDDHPAPSITDLVSFLQRKDVETYFSTHPNQLSSPTFLLPPEWESWWLWACSEDSEQSQDKWLLVWQYYAATSASQVAKEFLDIPERLRELLDSAREMRLSRRYVASLPSFLSAVFTAPIPGSPQGDWRKEIVEVGEPPACLPKRSMKWNA